MNYYEFQQAASQFQELIGYNFQNPKLLYNALVHRSYLNEKHRYQDLNEHNERLEFLGDAVAEIIVTNFLYQTFNEPEGFLTSLRAALVNYKNMGQAGLEIGLDNLILISNGEKAELGKARLSIVADAVEAIIGAIYLDGGYDVAKKFVDSYILNKLGAILQNQSYKDNKTQLQEYTQKYLKQTPRYQITQSQGKDHEKVFTIEVSVGGVRYSEGVGKSKQDAEIDAAGKALKHLKESNNL